MSFPSVHLINSFIFRDPCMPSWDYHWMLSRFRCERASAWWHKSLETTNYKSDSVISMRRLHRNLEWRGVLQAMASLVAARDLVAESWNVLLLFSLFVFMLPPWFFSFLLKKQVYFFPLCVWQVACMLVFLGGLFMQANEGVPSVLCFISFACSQPHTGLLQVLELF